MPLAPTCRHLHTDGRPCGSPALRGEPFCFHHHTARKPMPRRQSDDRCTPQLPAPDDFLAIQRGIGEVLRLLATDSLPAPLAATLLQGLSIASANLARHHRREEKRAALALAAGTPLAPPVTAYVNDPTHGTLAPDPQAPEALEAKAGQAQLVEQQPLPGPIPLLTPDPIRGTAYDDALLVEIHRNYTANFQDKLQRFEQAKSLELEALYDRRYTNLQADFDQRLAQSLAQLTTQPIRIPIQQNQDFSPTPQKHLALAG